MSKTLVLAEKPSVARDLARVLKCNKKNNGYIEGSKYIVTWALGHLVTLAGPGSYNEQYKSWRIEDLPIIPKHEKLEVIKKTSKQFKTVKSQLNRNDVNEIVIATDAGREGELVARWILEKAHTKKQIKRLWISSVTDRAIKDGFNNLKDGKQYYNLYMAAVARSQADWVVGINATRALTCKFNAELSCGRVQTPTLALIKAREDDIRNFKPKTYYGLTALTNGFKLTWTDTKSNQKNSFNKDKIEQIYNKIKHDHATVVDIKKTVKKSYSPKLYDLTELQRDASNRYGFSAKETLSIMQTLYERHKLLTYPRTDSRYITTDMVPTLKERVDAIAIGQYRSLANKINHIKSNKSFVDNKKVSDHHAIIPTEERVNLSKLSDRELKIYDLVIKRFMAVLYPPATYEQITLITSIKNEPFIAKGKRMIDYGWKDIYDRHEDDDEFNEKIPNLSKGDSLPVSKVSIETGETKPPTPFNEATLLSAMENPHKFMQINNKELKDTLSETGGLGTVATRADIIEKLYKKFFIEKKGNTVRTTSKGRQLLDLVPEGLKSPTLTAKWEQKLANIEKGKLNKNNYLNEMKDYAKKVVSEIKNKDEKFVHDNITGKKCPNCDEFLLEVNNKNTNMLVCKDRECGYKKVLSKLTNSRCPNCHKRLELFGEGDKQVFVCKCGHREKLTSFKKRKNNEKNKLSKRDVHKHLKKQNQQNDVPMNSALAEALKGFKVDK
ncbi:DNA topoisomerase III [Haloplasma contractile]|uniref:DNA topoisomerase 3 n=1 Tax=Haloplasma contractile SSD-17B TaxID=1033810 RepID=U2E7M5_9MOLU|nr:DNA topoisomerase 3 [Haloplasma contractile]ERJ11203.1 DNA topoisomerase 3 protein [Haloplasma contractile SSD-17B]